MKKFYWKIRIILLAFRWMPRFNLGALVWYQGKQWMLIQGVCAPIWELADLKTGERISVAETKMEKVRSLRNWLGSFKRGYDFYMSSWFDIWVHKGIQPWMRGCRIWAR